MTEKMPFQLKLPQVSQFAAISGIERAKMALPIFGGTTPTETKSTESSSGGSGEPSSTTSENGETSSAGGDSGKPKEMSPEEIASLLEQLSDTQNKLTEATKKITAADAEKQKQERAQMGKEEALTADLEQAQQTIIKMDAALKNQAIINAINSFRDIEFHDINFVLRELQSSASDVFENMDVDLENGTVTVKGVENHLRRIAKEKDWAVKKNAAGASTQQQNGNQPPAPPAGSSGAPPANPTTNQDKAARRKSLADKFPVIAHGRKL
jgi:hypothetical protein